MLLAEHRWDTDVVGGGLRGGWMRVRATLVSAIRATDAQVGR